MPGNGRLCGALEQDEAEAGGDKGVQPILEVTACPANCLGRLAGAAFEANWLLTACLNSGKARGTLSTKHWTEWQAECFVWLRSRVQGLQLCATL